MTAGHDSRKCVCGGVLELRERFVDSEGLCHVGRSLSSQRVPLQAAKESRMEASAGLDERKRARGGVLERGEGPVLGETLGEILSALRFEFIVVETANESQIGASAGIDTSGLEFRSGELTLP